MIIRAYEKHDAISLQNLYRRSVEQIGSRDYTPAQVTAWASLCPSAESFHLMSEDGRIRLVAIEASDVPIAFADLEPDGHIHFLYCAPEAAVKNVTSVLYDALEQTAQTHGMHRLYTEASEAARRFFLKRGFVVVSRRELDISGVAIHNYAMEKFLEPTAPGPR
ncbi:GNAT family N-acetyltransferase [Pelagibius sp. Alg239-R121]|uniref:GNAT family N-acetyltransferase n=1 Tax=Pelagibius sp. Alg239-R121 TaxID=2993448 RepID=UPI0024A635AD|nr:GNAT family N-acetyltransferase [Pelagibius sp. Alg239-R121]